MSPTIMDLETWALNLPMHFFLALIVFPLIFGILRISTLRSSGLIKVFGTLKAVDQISDGAFLYTIRGGGGVENFMTGRFPKGNRLREGHWIAALARADDLGNLVMLHSAQSLRMLRITSDGFHFGLFQLGLRSMCAHNILGLGPAGRRFYRIINVVPALILAVSPLFAVPYLDYKMRENRANVRNLGYSMLARDIAEGRIPDNTEAAGIERVYIWLEDEEGRGNERFFRLATLGISQLAWSITEANRIHSGVYGQSYRPEGRPIEGNHQIIAVLTLNRNIPLMHCGYEDGLLRRSGSLIHSEVDYSLLPETSGLHALCPPKYEPAGETRPISLYLEIFEHVNGFMMGGDTTERPDIGLEI